MTKKKTERILFAGTPDFAAVQLRSLLENGITPAAVLTQPDRASGRGLRRSPGPVAVLAEQKNLPLLQPEKLDAAFLDVLAELEPELVIVSAYGLLLPPEMLGMTKRGCINVHASLLPRHRGAAPVQHAILSGDTRTGISFMLMDKGLDTGPVLRRHELKLNPGWDAGQLTEQLALLGARHLPSLVEDWLAGKIEPVPQDHGLATHAPAIRPSDARIDWTKSAPQLQLLVRAHSPRPGAWCSVRDARWRILASETIRYGKKAVPGTLFCPGPGRMAVVCGEGALELIRLQRAGGRAMRMQDMLHGRPQDLQPGGRLN